MSKRLAKILSFCALAVLTPFIIVGSALAVTQAVGVTLSIAQSGINSTLGLADPAIAIMVDGKIQEENTIELKKNSSVDLSFEGEGYHFYGWYEGNADEIDIATDRPLANGAEDIKGFVVNGNKVLTAMRDVQTYNIVYTGNDANGNPITLEADNSLEYGSELEVLAGNAAKIFSGWAVKDSTTAPTRVAKFEATTQAQTIELVPVWKENASYKVFFSINDKSDANAVSITYTIAGGFSAYTTTREGYTFAGLTVNDRLYVSNNAGDYLYNGEKLSEYLANPANTDAEIYATWESNYPAIAIYFGAQAKYVKNGINGNYLLKYENGQFAETEGTTDAMYAYNQIRISDAAEIDYADNFFNYFFGDVTLYTDEAERRATEFNGKIRVVVTDVENHDVKHSYLDAADYTFGDVFEDLTNRYADINERYVQIIFEFDIV